ncbi:ABC transporter permease [Paracoccus ravus]|uniref:ABC transporter permease n=1 Tax=Paracoccus ravus TaxID=2447760 RepID=UPI00106E6FE0|nr:ABC transporter [Paracoccus ravus]
MFVQRRNRNMLEAAFTTFALIYHVTVNNLRKQERNPIIGLVMTVLRGVTMIAGFYLFYAILGIRGSPIRGDFVLYIMSGIFMFQTHTTAIGAVAGAGSPINNMTKHDPLNTAVLMSAAALAALYRQTIAAFTILAIYHYFIEPVHIEKPIACYGLLLLSWFSGCCIGLLFLSLRVWWPQGGLVATNVYQRLNLVFSGKMFVANTLSTAMLHTFSWNPLFHIIDQTRGVAFINYSPRNSSLTYPLYCMAALLMIGLMAEFVTRKSISVSSLAGR